MATSKTRSEQVGRPRLYLNAAERQAAYRARLAAEKPDLLRLADLLRDCAWTGLTPRLWANLMLNMEPGPLVAEICAQLEDQLNTHRPPAKNPEHRPAAKRPT